MAFVTVSNGLCTANYMAYSLEIMVEHRMRANYVAGVVRKIVATMINNSLECPDRSEECSLPVIQASYGKADWKAYTIYRNGLERMIVKSSIRKRHVYLMVH